MTHKVVSNDRIAAGIKRGNHTFVRGNFVEEPVRTNIGLALGDRLFDTVLSDMSPPFTGELEDDSYNLVKLIH